MHQRTLFRQRKRPRVTIRQVAAIAKVSPTAVSMARANHPQISEKTRQRVLRICREMGYDGARRETLAGQIGLVLVRMSLENPVNGILLQNLTRATADAELRLELHSSSPEDGEDVADHTIRTVELARKLDGLFLCGEVGRGLLDALADADVPVVVIGGAALPAGALPQSARMTVVCADHVGEGEFATSCLLACGHRRIGFISERLYPGLGHARWLAGYSAAHGLARVPLDPNLILLSGSINSDMSAVADAVAAMPERERPTAYAAPDVRQAWAFVQAMRRRAAIEVPRECVVMHGNLPMVQQYQMQDYPMTLTDYAQLARIAIWHLQALRAQPGAVGTTEVFVPFTAVNMPVPRTATSAPE
jgi:DNA-binding LacI/PurR family transcriptional regulator